jgi:hypothetical protein
MQNAAAAAAALRRAAGLCGFVGRQKIASKMECALAPFALLALAAAKATPTRYDWQACRPNLWRCCPLLLGIGWTRKESGLRPLAQVGGTLTSLHS